VGYQKVDTDIRLDGTFRSQVRTWTSWHRWATLARLTDRFLTVTAAIEHARDTVPADQRS
jgi:hypothetical protein